jgi:2-isopropylmalate synthase
MTAAVVASKEKAPRHRLSQSLTENPCCVNLPPTAMQIGTISKYAPYPPVSLKDRTWPDRQITKAPVWCSVDLRDGNQALPVPMTVEEKTELFLHLVDIGFKEIEVGFPSASETEFRFLRKLIDEKLIPADVTVQCLVQCRDHLIEKTFEAIDGAPSAIVHFYNSTNPLQRRVTFNLSKEEIKGIAMNGAHLCRHYLDQTTCGRVRFEYSPESFSDTELEFSLDVCEAVVGIIQPTVENKLILNLPATVELFTPNVHADQIEWFCRHLSCRDKVLISLHTHNDRGTGIAATELGLMAGADRVEGTLFGNGERTGNLDIVTVALNLYTQGVDPGLDFSRLPLTREIYERTTRMTVHDRHPYAGDLVFTAFSGSHQDAIKKGMDARAQSTSTRWEVPYLPIDCEDIGRTYQAIIRINSQSGKGGVAYILERGYGIQMPKGMHPEFGQVVTALADNESAELNSLQIWEAFDKEYLQKTAPMRLLDYEIDHKPEDVHRVHIEAQIEYEGQKRVLNGRGNGPIAAFVNALANADLKNFSLSSYAQHSISKGSAANAVSFVKIEREPDGRAFWGASIDSNVENGGLLALVSAINRASE